MNGVTAIRMALKLVKLVAQARAKLGPQQATFLNPRATILSEERKCPTAVLKAMEARQFAAPVADRVNHNGRLFEAAHDDRLAYTRLDRVTVPTVGDATAIEADKGKTHVGSEFGDPNVLKKTNERVTKGASAVTASRLGKDEGEPMKKKTRKKEAKAKDDGSNGGGEDVVDVGRVDLRVGRILKAEKHPAAESLYVEQVDLGEVTPRTIVSGLVNFVPLEQMQSRLVVCVCNLKPVRMRGIVSQAMLLCAATREKVEILEVDPACEPGQRVFCTEVARHPDAVLAPKKRIWETVAADLRVGNDGQVAFRGHKLLVEGRTPVTAPSLRDVPVK